MALASRDGTEELIRAYKVLLSAAIDKRPSGTRQRLADALGKHRSFISQITGVSYPTPVPERHLLTIFSLCHFSLEEQRAFLEIYDAAHPERAGRLVHLNQTRLISLQVRDFGDDEKNRRFEEAITEFTAKLSDIIGDSMK